jgi:hypothetical protein
MSLISVSLLSYGSIGIINMLRSSSVFSGKELLLEKDIFEQTNKRFPKLEIMKCDEMRVVELIQLDKNTIFNIFPMIDRNMITKEYKCVSPVYFAIYNSIKHFGIEERAYSDNLNYIILNYTTSSRLPFTCTSLAIGFIFLNM